MYHRKECCVMWKIEVLINTSTHHRNDNAEMESRIYQKIPCGIVSHQMRGKQLHNDIAVDNLSICRN